MQGSSDQRGHRPDLSDPTQLAVEVSELRGAFALLQSQCNGAIQNLTGSVQAVQAELRNLGNKVEEVTRLQVHTEQHSEGLERAFAAIQNLADMTRETFEKDRASVEGYRTRREREEGQWRAEHVKENQETRDKVMRFSGAAVVISGVATMLVAVVMWYSDKIDTAASREQDMTNAAVRENTGRIRNIESYLSQGGAKPEQPYSPGK